MGEFLEKLWTTLYTVVIAVGASAAIWIGANLIFNQVRTNWSRFNALAYGVVGFGAAVLLSGNRITRYSGPADSWYAKFGYWVWLPLVCGAACALVGWLLARTEAPAQRLLIGAGGLGGVGVFAGAMVRDDWFPDFEIVPIVAWPLIGAAVGAGVAVLRQRTPARTGLLGAAIGWLIGSWGMPDLGNEGNLGWTIVAMAVPPALIGARQALTAIPSPSERAAFDTKSRAVIFLAPGLLFIFATLVVPAILTLLLSFQDRESEEWVGFDNYQTIFQDRKSIDFGAWGDMFTSRLFWLGAILLVLFAIAGSVGKQRTGKVVELGSPSMGPLVAGGFFVSLAIFTTIRGTIINNIWWVVVVTLFSTGLGLAVAVLADGVPFEKIAKSIIFMPMAISLVGASIIWRFMYVARDSSKEQTGVMNAMWIGLGRLSTGQEVAGTAFFALLLLGGLGSTLARVVKRDWIGSAIRLVATIVGVAVFAAIWNSLGGNGTKVLVGLVLIAIFVAIVYAGVKPLVRQEFGKAVVPAIGAILLGWFLLRYWQIIGGSEIPGDDGGVGGQRINSGGNLIPDAINFIQDGPFNNMWLMVVLIWIQTGFAMVILSAAIKAVPQELIEAAKVDGATDSQVFWRVTLPQIATTIGVVVTTLIVLVMKVYDIVKVMTNGNFDTEVLANSMFREAFLNLDRGLGAALAILIFLSVLPIMYLNIRRMQREA